MTPILGAPQVTASRAEEWAIGRGATSEFVSLARPFWVYGSQRGGVRPEVAYAQSAKETGFGRFGGVIDASYHNPCGLKTAKGGDNKDPYAHQRFHDWHVGVIAHLDHLAIYAGAYGYPRLDTPDPRHFPWLHGKAPSVEQLSRNWAGAGYGESIVNDYLKGLLA